jgi:hypothetical protein
VDIRPGRMLRERLINNPIYDFFCVGAMYSGEYDACDVTLSVDIHSE